jgi:hypothetical protein
MKMVLSSVLISFVSKRSEAFEVELFGDWPAARRGRSASDRAALDAAVITWTKVRRSIFVFSVIPEVLRGSRDAPGKRPPQ